MINNEVKSIDYLAKACSCLPDWEMLRRSIADTCVHNGHGLDLKL